MAKLTSKKKRAALFAQQEQCCALCEEYLSSSKDMCYDEKQNSLLCRRCTLFVRACRTSNERGVTFVDIVDYEENTPQDIPVLKTERRQCVEDGRFLYTDPDGGKRRYKDWDEYLKHHPEYAEAEERLNG